jgi:hypothetical protein
MGKFEVKILGRADRIQYSREDKRSIIIPIDLYALDKETLKLKDIKNWEEPYENEEISIEEKQQILIDINNAMNGIDGWGIKIDISLESNIIHYDEIYDKLKILSNGIDISSFKKTGSKYKYDLVGTISYLFFAYYKLPKDELMALKNKLSANKNIQEVFISFSKWKVNEDRENINQKKFNYGLYALEMILLKENKEAIKEVLKQYVSTSREKNLSFEGFMSRNSHLNELIEEALNQRGN